AGNATSPSARPEDGTSDLAGGGARAGRLGKAARGGRREGSAVGRVAAAASPGGPDDVGGVAVEVVPVPVVAAGGAGIGVPHRVLDVFEGHPFGAGGGGEGVPKRVRRQAGPRGDAGLSGEPPHQAEDGVSIQPAAGSGREQWAGELVDGHVFGGGAGLEVGVDGGGGAGGQGSAALAAAFADEADAAVAALIAQVGDVEGDEFADA